VVDDANGIAITITVDSKQVDDANVAVSELTAKLKELQNVASSGIFKTINEGAKDAASILEKAAEGLKTVNKEIAKPPSSAGIQTTLESMASSTEQASDTIINDITGVARKLRDITGMSMSGQLQMLDNVKGFWSGFRKSMFGGEETTGRMQQFTNILNNMAKNNYAGTVAEQFAKAGQNAGYTTEQISGLASEFNVLYAIMQKASGKEIAPELKSAAINTIASKFDIKNDEAEKVLNRMAGGVFDTFRSKASTKGFEADPMFGNVDPIINDLSKLAQMERDVAISSEAMKQATKLSTEGLNQLSKKTEFSPVQLESYSRASQEIDNLAESEKMASEATYLMNNAHRLSPELLTTVSSATGITADNLIKYSQSLEKSAKDSQILQVYMRSSRAAIGPLGSAFRDVTMQVYWASLGFLFLTMTMSRAEKAEYTKLQNANSLAKSYYNLSKMQRELNKTVSEYGAGSEEARDASAQFLMAQKDLELQQKQLKIAVKGEVLAGLQAQFSTLPLMVNTIYTVVTAYGALSGMIAASRAGKLADAQIDVLNSSTKRGLAISTMQTTSVMGYDTIAKTVNTGATSMNGVAQLLLAGKVRQAATAFKTLIATSTMASTAMTMGIGLIVSLIAYFGIQALAEQETAREMAKLNAETADLSSQYENAGASALNMASAYEETVTPSLRAAREEIVRLTGELNSLKDNTGNAIGTNGLTLGSAGLAGNITGTTQINQSSLAGNSKGVSVNVTFNGLTVRDDKDVDNINNNIGKTMRTAGVVVV
jgi:hypothetical protein